MEKLDLVEFMKDKEIASFKQSRGEVDYLLIEFYIIKYARDKKI